jgi:hypothetical protein
LTEAFTRRAILEIKGTRIWAPQTTHERRQQRQ